MAFHLYGSGRVSGGIDIFLAISGFLFTAMLLREATESGGSIRAGRYFLRLLKRLVIPAALVITVTFLAAWMVFPSTRHPQLLIEARASLFYVENWQLIADTMSYEVAGAAASPFQHFWSLSVQGQFFLIWPLVAIAAVWCAKRLNRSATSLMIVLVMFVLAASLIHAVYMQTISQDRAYFMTTTRFWEFAFGGLLALVSSRITLGPSVRLVAGWAGLGMVVSTGFIMDGAEVFPGPLALWPLLGFALILMSSPGQDSNASPRPGVERLLTLKPIGWVGDLAYGLYLWHWPLLIFYLEVRDRDEVGLRGGTLILLLSFALAWLTHRLVEVPLSRSSFSRPRLKLGLAAGTLVAAAVGTSAAIGVLNAPAEARTQPSSTEGPSFGAAAVGTPWGDLWDGAEVHPPIPNIANDMPAYYGWDCRQRNGHDPGTGEALVCEDPDAPSTPRATVMIAGGSHAGQWHQAFVVMAEQNDWELLVVDKSGCRFGGISNVETNKCAEWNVNFLDVLDERQPDLVITPGSVVAREGDGPETIEAGAPDRWQEITESGSELLLMRGTPRPNEDAPECLAEGGGALECGPTFETLADDDPLDGIDLPDSTHTLDMTEYLCFDGSCPAVIGEVAVYRDSSHLTNSYVESMVPMLEEELRGRTPDLFRG
ncbi:acyltransferase [Nesterenkonia sp. LB17]|nr:acyltransferase [Nesterenkonia sp. LB17]